MVKYKIGHQNPSYRSKGGKAVGSRQQTARHIKRKYGYSVKRG